jgi:hypothetical protein
MQTWLQVILSCVNVFSLALDCLLVVLCHLLADKLSVPMQCLIVWVPNPQVPVMIPKSKIGLQGFQLRVSQVLWMQQ